MIARGTTLHSAAARPLRDYHAARHQQRLRPPQVTCLTASPSGRYLASGQKTNMGFIADAIIWDVAKRAPVHKLSLHKVMVKALAFSHDESTLATLGGPDDATLILWVVATGEALCGAPAHNSVVHTLRFLSTDAHRLVTAGEGATPRPPSRKCHQTLRVGQTRAKRDGPRPGGERGRGLCRPLMPSIQPMHVPTQ